MEWVIAKKIDENQNKTKKAKYDTICINSRLMGIIM